MKAQTQLHEHSPWWQFFTPAEREILRALSPHDLAGEMDLLRGGLLQFFEDEQHSPASDRQLQAEKLKAYARAAAAIGVMERTRLKAQGVNSRWDVVIKAAYQLARQQMDVENYLDRLTPLEDLDES